MYSIIKKLQSNKIILIILLLALLVRTVIALAPFEWLLERGVLVDDAFYYFKIARNLIDGYGVTFDTLSPTNGFHPLWLISILPLFALFSGKIIVLHSVLLLSALIGTASVAVLYFLLRELRINKNLNLAVTSFYALSPTVLLSGAGTMNGLETSLNVFMMLLFILLYFRIFRGNPQVVGRHILGFAVVSGLLFLTRTDNAIFIVVFWLFLTFHFWRYKHWKDLRALLMSGVLTVALAAPWLLWSYLEFGSVVQVSGKAVPFIRHEELSMAGWNALDYAVQYVKNGANSLIYLFGLLTPSKKSLLFIYTIVLFFTASFWFLRRNFHGGSLPKSVKTQFKKALYGLTPLLISYAVFLLIHTLRVVELRGWYYFSVYPLLLVLGVVVVDFSIKRQKENNIKSSFLPKVILGLYLGGVLFGLGRFIVSPTIFFGELSKYKVITRVNRELPQHSVVGAWSAGLYGYFFEKGKLVNLDGVANNEVYPYIKGYRVGDYARKVGVEYLLDERAALESRHWGKNLPIDEMEVSAIFKDDRGREFLWGKLINK